MLKKGSKSWLAFKIVESILLFIAGLFTVIFSGNGDFRQTIIIIIGSVVVAVAVIAFLVQLIATAKSNNAFEAKAFLNGTFAAGMELASGIALLIIACNKTLMESILNFIGQYLGIVVLVFAGIMVLATIIFGSKKKIEKGNVVSNSVCAFLLIALGVILLIICGNNGAMNLLFVIIGIMLMGLSIALIVSSSITRKHTKATEPDAKKEDIKDVDVIEKK